MEARHTSNLWTYLEVKWSKVKVTRPINMRFSEGVVTGYRNSGSKNEAGGLNPLLALVR